MDNYERNNYRLGNIWTAAALVLMALIPVVTSLVIGAKPDWPTFFKVWIGLSVIYLPTAIAEVCLYTPMIGTNAAYLSFITGNLSNLKIPCAVNSMDIVGAEKGSEAGDVVSTISIAVSTIVTLIIISVGVFFLGISGLSDYLASPKAAFLTPAFGTVAFALFGALGGKYLVKYPRVAMLPIVGIVLVCFILTWIKQSSLATAGNMLFVGVIACYLNARRLYYKKCQEEEAAIKAAAEAAATDAPDLADAEIVTAEVAEQDAETTAPTEDAVAIDAVNTDEDAISTDDDK